MAQDISHIIQAQELSEVLDNDNLVIVNAGSGNAAREAYSRNHLKGALYVDLNTDLSDIKKDAAEGGRHPLPTSEQFSEVLTRLGVTRASHVVTYDDQSGANAAARFWWMLRAVGHEKVQVLNGGIQAAEKAGLPMSAEQEQIKSVEPYKVGAWILTLADIEEVEQMTNDEDQVVIDVRSAERYEGITEPIDLIAGHIPGAINIPLTENLDKNGFFRSPEELRRKYAALFEENRKDQIAVHCGSGVTACHTLLAMAYAGFDIPKLYVGSWSEWSRNNKPMVTK